MILNKGSFFTNLLLDNIVARRVVRSLIIKDTADHVSIVAHSHIIFMKVVTQILENEFCLGSLNWVFLVLFVHYLCGKVQNLIENIVTISEEHIAVRRVKLSIGFQVVGHNCQVLLQSGSRPNNHSICEWVRHAT